MKWGFINIALVLVSQGWEGWGGGICQVCMEL